jgi:signal transduction histidine kinase
MDFVTAVSHELRTPLTVISSAAENVAHGVVEGKEQLRQYGTVIANHARQLSGLVEEVLLFASTRDGHQRYVLKPLAVEEIVDATLSATDGLIQAARFTVQRDIDPHLPGVKGDLLALSQCLQNLITNALKYGRDQRWLGVSARVGEGDNGEREVLISVSDRGVGIDPADLPHIFEPFYRGASATAAQIHGTGLGLSLALRTAEAMGGRLTVISAMGRGSTFTLHLPCERAIEESEVAPAPVTA